MFENLPIEITPLYTSAAVNAPIKLYNGKLELYQNGEVFEGSGSVEFDWLPLGQIRFTFVPNGAATGRIALDAARLRLVSLETEAEADLIHVSFSFPTMAGEPVQGIIQCVDSGDLASCLKLRFHLANVPSLIGLPVRTNTKGQSKKRVVLEYGEWRATVDGISADGITAAQDRDNELRRTGGSALTHVGKVERIDGTTFSFGNSEPFLTCVGYFFSFCRSAWTQPLLLTGEGANENILWRRWATTNLDRYKSTYSWVPSARPVSKDLSAAFKGFAAAWFSGLWSDAIRIAVQWYVEGGTGAVEKSIILLQAALELICWTRLVHETKSMTEGEWNNTKKNPFFAKLRRVLSNASVPLSIPTSLTELTDYCDAEKIDDGPQAITAVRNALVHANSRKRTQLTAQDGLLIETWLMASWYADLCLLSICGYRGAYANRTAVGQNDIENVPWR